MTNSLEKKVAVITGAASGIGLATTERLIREGATVVMVDKDAAALEKHVARLGEQAIGHVADLLDPEQCNALVQDILKRVPHIDIMHCNAGLYLGGDLVDATPEAIDRMLTLNVNVVMKNVRSILPHMIDRKSGDVLVTCSVAGHFPTYWEPVYSGSKWAIQSFVQGVRRQMVPHGIRVGQVSPGPVISALLADWPEENLRKAKEAGGLIDAEEVADAIAYMLTRKRTVTIRDIVILPSNFDRV